MLDKKYVTIETAKQGIERGTLHTEPSKLAYLEETELIFYADGLDNFLDYVQEAMPEPRRAAESSKYGSSDFNAFDTYEEALDTFRNHPDRVVEFDESEIRISDESESGSTVDYDVVGDYIDMGRFMEGVPESWGSMHAGRARNRRANIIVNLGQVHYISHEVIKHRAERILRLVDALEAGGVRTQLTGISSSQCSHIEIVLKHHDEPLTIADLAVATHPEFLRRVFFRVIEHSQTFDYGYGRAMEFDRAVDSYPELLHSDNNDEINIFIGSNISSEQEVDEKFDKLERLLAWEMSKPVPEVDSIKLSSDGIQFNPNGARSEQEIREEGLSIIKESDN